MSPQISPSRFWLSLSFYSTFAFVCCIFGEGEEIEADFFSVLRSNTVGIGFNKAFHLDLPLMSTRAGKRASSTQCIAIIAPALGSNNYH